LGRLFSTFQTPQLLHKLLESTHTVHAVTSCRLG
jgi:hypothetical protein